MNDPGALNLILLGFLLAVLVMVLMQAVVNGIAEIVEWVRRVWKGRKV